MGEGERTKKEIHTTCRKLTQHDTTHTHTQHLNPHPTVATAHLQHTAVELSCKVNLGNVFWQGAAPQTIPNSPMLKARGPPAMQEIAWPAIITPLESLENTLASRPTAQTE